MSQLSAGAGGQTSAPMLEVNPLTSEMLQDAKPAEKKRLIGERLFPKIQVVEPRLAGKITGMLLEMDNAELLVLLSEQRTLIDKINEAMAVLQSQYLVLVLADEAWLNFSVGDKVDGRDRWGQWYDAVIVAHKPKGQPLSNVRMKGMNKSRHKISDAQEAIYACTTLGSRTSGTNGSLRTRVTVAPSADARDRAVQRRASCVCIAWRHLTRRPSSLRSRWPRWI